MEKLITFDDGLNEMLKDDIELCREMVKRGIENYHESGDDKDISRILLNLGRIIKARGYKDFETLNLSDTEIGNAIESKENYSPDIINKMFEALEIKEKI